MSSENERRLSKLEEDSAPRRPIMAVVICQWDQAEEAFAFYRDQTPADKRAKLVIAGRRLDHVGPPRVLYEIGGEDSTRMYKPPGYSSCGGGG